jgi:hypothetical protein
MRDNKLPVYKPTVLLSHPDACGETAELPAERAWSVAAIVAAAAIVVMLMALWIEELT